MITLSAESKMYGNTGQYLARIIGRSTKYTYNREFIGRKADRYTSALIDDAGIYEDCDIDKKGRKEPGFWLVLPRPQHAPPLTEKGDPDWIKVRANEDDVMTLAKRLDAGEALVEMVEIVPAADGGYTYKVRTPGAAKRAAQGATIGAAIEACWQILQAFPEKQAKEVLKQLKARVSPPSAPVPAQAAPEPVDSPKTAEIEQWEARLAEDAQRADEHEDIEAENKRERAETPTRTGEEE